MTLNATILYIRVIGYTTVWSAIYDPLLHSRHNGREIGRRIKAGHAINRVYFGFRTLAA